MARTNLKLFRVAKNMSQAEFAKKIGYVRTTVADIEKGKREGRKTFWNALQREFSLDDETVQALQKND